MTDHHRPGPGPDGAAGRRWDERDERRWDERDERWWGERDERDERWWAVPALATPLALFLLYVDYTAYPARPAVWALGYSVPLALLGCGWLLERTVRRRPLRTVLTGLGCLLALGYTQVMVTVLTGIAVVQLFFRVAADLVG
ncbi:hypothetical protein [Streptomyces jumonjinensis]|uniref:hypothetical protein n=1 Tax=Streptomyces jumonjinensis TaxID=1945 RepID=UPI00379C2ABD